MSTGLTRVYFYFCQGILIQISYTALKHRWELEEQQTSAVIIKQSCCDYIMSFYTHSSLWSVYITTKNNATSNNWSSRETGISTLFIFHQHRRDQREYHEKLTTLWQWAWTACVGKHIFVDYHWVHGVVFITSTLPLVAISNNFDSVT